MTEEIHDTSRVDAFMAARRRAMMLHAAWRPMLAGAAGAALVIACVWVVLPKVSYREVEIPRVKMVETEVPHIVMRDAVVPNIITKNIEIAIPASAPRTSEERMLEGSDAWRGADVRGRILRQEGNGFVLMTDAGDQSFSPARLDAAGKVEADESMKDDVGALLNDLAFCRPQPPGLYQCVAVHKGREVVVPEVPIKQGRPA